jgi:hypothetical protein
MVHSASLIYFLCFAPAVLWEPLRQMPILNYYMPCTSICSISNLIIHSLHFPTISVRASPRPTLWLIFKNSLSQSYFIYSNNMLQTPQNSPSSARYQTQGFYVIPSFPCLFQFPKPLVQLLVHTQASNVTSPTSLTLIYPV